MCSVEKFYDVIWRPSGNINKQLCLEQFKY